MAEEKNYAKGCWAREKVFSNGNSIITLSGKTEEFCAWLRSITDDKGQFKAGVSKRREIIEGKPTHTVWQDTWKPTPKADAQAVPKSDQPPWGAATPAQPSDDLPFN
jgi:hypothetical protein